MREVEPVYQLAIVGCILVQPNASLRFSTRLNDGHFSKAKSYLKPSFGNYQPTLSSSKLISEFFWNMEVILDSTTFNLHLVFILRCWFTEWSGTLFLSMERLPDLLNEVSFSARSTAACHGSTNQQNSALSSGSKSSILSSCDVSTVCANHKQW